MDNNLTIKQISVFLENKAGRTNSVTRILDACGVRILALSISESGDFGLLRLIVDDVQKACLALKEARFAVILTDVLHVRYPDGTGSLTKILDHLADNNISVDYMYAMQYDGMSAAIIRPKDLNRCIEAMKEFQ
jgi:hypothetical protein